MHITCVTLVHVKCYDEVTLVIFRDSTVTAAIHLQKRISFEFGERAIEWMLTYCCSNTVFGPSRVPGEEDVYFLVMYDNVWSLLHCLGDPTLRMSVHPKTVLDVAQRRQPIIQHPHFHPICFVPIHVYGAIIMLVDV